MLNFSSDYLEGAHPLILKKLIDSNMEQTSGYCTDHYCEIAKNKIRKACNCENADVHFLVEGTQANVTIIKSLLRSHEGVISADTGHINFREAGAIEATGHKVLTIPNKDGKVYAKSVDDYIKAYYADKTHNHMVKPGLLYISFPTEYGTLYSKSELEDLSAVCKKHDIYFFIDGARLGYGLMANNNDVTLDDISQYCDAFYIGGTKIGALFGEAVVITKPDLIPYFFTTTQQQGAVFAKGRILGIQFDILFSDNLYYKISKHAINMSEKIKEGLTRKGYGFYLDSPTNQQFIVVDNNKLTELEKKVSFGFCEKYDEHHSVIRFVTSWATKESDVCKLLELL